MWPPPPPATQGLDPDAADGPRAEDQPHGLAGGKKKRSDRGEGREMADAQQAPPLFAALKKCEECLGGRVRSQGGGFRDLPGRIPRRFRPYRDRKSTRLNSSHSQISYAVFC